LPSWLLAAFLDFLMPSGTFTDNLGRVLPVSSSDCLSVRASFDRLHASYPQPYEAISCTSDPVVVGTVLNFKHSTGSISSLTITAIDATPDFSVGTYVLLVCVAVLLFVFGFHSGNKAA